MLVSVGVLLLFVGFSVLWLLFDVGGYFVKFCMVCDFFDYCLIVWSDLSVVVFDVFVVCEIVV